MHHVDSHYRSTVPPGAARPTLASDVDTEVCMVGGRLAGLASALALRERLIRVRQSS